MNLSITKDIPDRLLELYLTKKEIAVDSEFQGLRLFRDDVCLIQICDDKKNISLVKPDFINIPPNLKHLLTNTDVTKVFHFAICDVSFIKTSLDIEVSPYCCTKVMSKLIRTYTNKHGLKDLFLELLGQEISKEQQQTNWSLKNLTQKQLLYAANDVVDLLQIYRILNKMINDRPTLSTGESISELNIKAQSMLPGLVDLIINGYGDKNGGWETSLFSH